MRTLVSPPSFSLHPGPQIVVFSREGAKVSHFRKDMETKSRNITIQEGIGGSTDDKGSPTAAAPAGRRARRGSPAGDPPACAAQAFAKPGYLRRFPCKEGEERRGRRGKDTAAQRSKLWAPSADSASSRSGQGQLGRPRWAAAAARSRASIASGARNRGHNAGGRSRVAGASSVARSVVTRLKCRSAAGRKL